MSAIVHKKHWNKARQLYVVVGITSSSAWTMIVTAKLNCSGCGHSGSAEWKAYRPKLIRELKAVRGRFIASASAYGSRGSFLCQACRCEAETSDEVFLREATVPVAAIPAAHLAPSLSV